ncbi:MAG: 16S rRNA (cytidine(1402)-2'-O)-methyltransferase [Candidatus Pacebacteria bacterium]|nr:16S rRNA (cytidine(1402)-2'-O)-methyltransferase [Candidatus Paceibacterota bacterium]
MILSIVATPIGNLKDISVRAKEVLEQATLVVAEDTRTSGQLFKLLGIEGDREFVSSHAFSSENDLKKALERCQSHEFIVLVTDAGTPAISDPGSFFISKFRKAFPEASIVPVPGPSAVISALSVCGYPTSHFEFLGFIPHKKGRQTLFARISELEHVVAFYESPHRILKTLEELDKNIPNREMFIGREMTKMFEEYRWGFAKDHLDYYQNNPGKCKGEFVCVISQN